MQGTAAQAAETASQATAAASAYDAAFAAHVPPEEIAANRSQLASLVSTNIIGQNNAAIAATEAHYGEMWAQDALAMDTYADSSASATTLTPFSPAPQVTNSGGLAGQAAAAAQATSTSAGTAAQSIASTAGLHRIAAAAMAGKPVHRLHGYPQRPAEQPVWVKWGINVHGAFQRGQDST